MDKKTQIRAIRTLYFVMFFVSLWLLAALYLIEQDDDNHANFLAEPMTLSNRTTFVLECLTVLYTMFVIYMTTKLLKFPSVCKYIAAQPARRFQEVEVLRFAFLESSVLLNGTLYALFQMVPNFYLCVISLIAFVFLYPNRAQCEEFLGGEQENEED